MTKTEGCFQVLLDMLPDNTHIMEDHTLHKDMDIPHKDMGTPLQAAILLMEVAAILHTVAILHMAVILHRDILPLADIHQLLILAIVDIHHPAIPVHIIQGMDLTWEVCSLGVLLLQLLLMGLTILCMGVTMGVTMAMVTESSSMGNMGMAMGNLSMGNLASALGLEAGSRNGSNVDLMVALKSNSFF